MRCLKNQSANAATSLITLAAVFLSASSQASDRKAETDIGTDPTRVSNTVVARYEHMALRDGFSSGILRLKYIAPVGPRQNYALSFEVPISSVDVLGNNNYALGDVMVGLTHVFGLTREGGYVAKGEFYLDTAERRELGTGKNVFKGTFIKAWFLSDGAIFAPALVHEASLSGQHRRADVSRTTMDFYYVPKMADRRNLITFDPNIVRDWENKRTYGALSVTFGRVIGKAFGGNQIVFVKPTVFAGANRPANWGLELGCKVIGF